MYKDYNSDVALCYNINIQTICSWFIKSRKKNAKTGLDYTSSPSPSFLPSNLGQGTLRESSNEHLSNLIHDQNTQRQRNRDKPKLNGHSGSTENVLDTGLHGDEDGDGERNSHASEQPRVSAFSAERIGLEDGHFLAAHAEQVAELHNHQSDKVDALAHGVEVVEFGLGVAVEAFGVALEGEEEVADRDLGVAPVVEEEHGVCADGFHDTDEEVGLGVDLEVDEMVLLVVAGR